MHHLRLVLPSFAALGSPDDASGTGFLAADVDGRPVWREKVAFYAAPVTTLAFGKNTVGSSVAEPVLNCTLGDLRQDFGGR